MSRRARSRWWGRARLPLLAVAAAAASYLMLTALARWMLYPAPPVAVPAPPPPLAEVRLPVGGGEVVGWAATPPDAEGGGRPAVVFFHGNGENLETMRRSGSLAAMLELGSPFLIIDYPGYGRSSGRPSEAALVAAATAAVDWAAGELAAAGRDEDPHPLPGADPPAGRVVVCGWSLGAAVAIQAAVARPDEVAGLVLLSPWTSLPAVAAGHFPSPLVRALLRERYDSLTAAPGLRLPALVIHGAEDRIIPAAHGRALAAALPGAGAAVELPGTGHNDLLGHPGLWRRIGAFLAAL